MLFRLRLSICHGIAENYFEKWGGCFVCLVRHERKIWFSVLWSTSGSHKSLVLWISRVTVIWTVRYFTKSLYHQSSKSTTSLKNMMPPSLTTSRIFFSKIYIYRTHDSTLLYHIFIRFFFSLFHCYRRRRRTLFIKYYDNRRKKKVVQIKMNEIFM